MNQIRNGFQFVINLASALLKRFLVNFCGTEPNPVENGPRKEVWTAVFHCCFSFDNAGNVFVVHWQLTQGSMTTVEFVLLNGAKVDVRDNNGQGPLHHATQLGHTGFDVLVVIAPYIV